jgi:hypothetical protein
VCGGYTMFNFYKWAVLMLANMAMDVLPAPDADFDETE